MSVRTDVINLQVNINGNAGQAQLNNLRKRAADVRFEMEGLKKGTQAFIDKKKELSGITAEMDRLKKQIGLTALNQKELVKELNSMKAMRSSMQPFTDEWKKLDKEIKKVENRLYDVKNGVQGFSSFFSKIKDEVKQFGMLAAGYLGFQFLSTQFTNIIRGGGKMSDTLADIRRVAGLTEEEVSTLNKSLRELDTRTSVQSLREIAVTAGKLGVAKDDLLGFTAAVDKLVVALGDELGGADQITDQLGKILNVFDGRIDGENITRLANSFVELANTGSSTGAFIADFDQRLSGIAKSSGISLGALSGLGAAVQEMGGKVESSSTAIQKIIVTIAQDIPKAARIANKSVQEFSNTFANSPEEALLQFSEGLVKNKQSFAEIVASFGDAGEEGARVIETLSKLGQSADYVRERIDLGKKSFQETGAITEAFRIKNETFGATLDKLGKEFNRLVTSPAVVGFLQSAVEGAFKFIQALQRIPAFISDNKVALLTLTAGIILLNKAYVTSALVVIRDSVAKAYNAVVTKATAIATNFAITAQAAYITITNLLTGRITIATAAQRLWNVALGLGATGIGALLLVAGGLVLAIKNIFTAQKQYSAQQKADMEVAKRASEIYTDQVTRLDLLKKKLLSTTVSLDEKKKAYNELIQLHPEFANTLKLDAEGHLQGANAIDVYITELKKKAEIEAKYSLLVDKLKQRTELFNKMRDENKDMAGLTDDQLEERIRQTADKSLSFFSGPNKRVVVGAMREIVKELNVIKTLQSDIVNNKTATTSTSNTGSSSQSLFTGSGKKDKTDSKLDQLKKDAEAFAEEIKRLRRELEINGMSADEAEIARIEDKYAELLKKALKYNYDILEIEGLKNTELERLYKKFYEKAAKYELERKAKQADEEEKEFKNNIEKFKDRQKEREDELDKNAEEYNKKRKSKKDKDEEELLYWKKKIQNAVYYAEMVNGILTSIANISNAKDNNELVRDKKKNDEKKKNLKKQLDSKLLSEEQYNLKVTQMDEELAAKETEIKRKQAQREKALNIFQSIINTASAVAEALPDINKAIAVGIYGAIQTALIAATPLPEFGLGDWIRKGDKHKDKSRGITAKIERDEAIMSAPAMTSSKNYMVSGTTAQITSALNSAAGGTNWAGGAKVVEMPKWVTADPAMVNPSLPGILQSSATVQGRGAAVNTAVMEALLAQLVKEQQANTEEIKNMKTKLHAVVSIKELRQQEEDYDAAKKASGL